jgi:ribosomal protein L11 methyltransferase
VLKDEDWRDSWKKYFGIQKIGKNVVVAPTWVDYKMKRGDIVLRIDPGMAFGTGQHPTTAMCLRALEEFVSDRAAVLDLGCGSGILALAAAKLGAARVVAVDNDPQAVKATNENVGANDVTVDVREGTLDVANGETFDLIVANISGLTLARLAPTLAASLAPGGRLVLSGFLEDTVEALREALTATGLGVQRVDEEGVWRAIVAVKA